jgi:pimeloyl-ACP methyl ester carboxylesterase
MLDSVECHARNLQTRWTGITPSKNIFRQLSLPIEQGLPQASKAFKPDSNGNWWIEQEHFAADFAADIPKDKAAFMAVSQVPISTDSFTHKVTTPAWKTKPTWYMVATADRSINPDQERMMAKRANAKTIEVNASHVAYMSHPKETAKLIEEAATSVQAKSAAND